MKTDPTPEQTSEVAKTAEVSPKREPLQLPKEPALLDSLRSPHGLPKGAFIAFRKSGGAPVSAHTIVLYPDGRVSFGGPDMAKEAYAHVPRKMNDAQIARLRKTLDHINFFRMTSAQGSPPADAFAYEISARGGNRVNSVTVFDGAIPDALTPLIHQLSALMPKA